MSLLEELKRRNVIRVGIAYAAAAWLLAQAADLVLDVIGAPELVLRSLVALLALGFIPALVFAWVFEITPEGIRKESEIDLEQSTANVTAKKLEMVTIGLLAAAVVLLVFDRSIPGLSKEQTAVQQEAEIHSPGAAPREETTDSLSARNSIAVLPFATRSEEKADEYFSQGILDDLLTHLARIDGIKVISRTSVMRYADTTKPIGQIAKELGVTTILEGGIQRAGERVRINAQLIEAQTDSHLWAQSWDKELTVSNIFEIQSELTRLIADALRAELLPDMKARMDRRPTEDMRAYDLTLRGKYLMDKELTQSNLEGAADLFREAIEADPGYASAWAGLAHALQELVGWHYRPEQELWPEAWEAVQKAIALDPDNIEALLALGDMQRMDRRYDEGEQTFLRAIELSPGSADAHSRYSDLLRDARRLEESADEIRRAVNLDPHHVRIRESMLQNLYFSRNFDEVHAEARALLELEPGAAGAWYWLGLTLALQGAFGEAEQAMLEALELDPTNSYYSIGRAYIYAWNGRRDAVLKILEGPGHERFSLVEVGLVYGALGDMDRAFESMNRAFEETPAALYYIAADPSADPMRDDPRWQELLARLEAE